MQTVVNIQQAGDIYYINNWIKQNYKVDFSVEDLAEQRSMSLSTFHRKFKSAVGMGPLQCQKKLRLMEARRLMLDEAATVTDAAMEVGYESVSQFIRDYRRMFGRSPQKDVQEIRAYIQTELIQK
ncbi:MAG: helix-turn-helix domain-containing protein [Anaerovoracaceae bacterium]